MYKKSRFIIVLSLVLSMVFPTFALATEDLPVLTPQSIEESIQAKADYITENLGVSGLQYALIVDGEITLSGNSGVYDKDASEALTSDTMYGIGSISKMYTTASVMKLVDEGKINLDTPVYKYMPEFKMADSRYKDITPRMLLNHSSGIMGSSLSNSFLLGDNDTVNHDNFLTVLSAQHLKADPGEYSVYCNDGFTLAELLVEKVSNMTFTKFIEKTFSIPLDLQNTKTLQDEFDRNQIARSYSHFNTLDIVLPLESVNVIGTGGIYATASDVCRFATVYMEDTGILSNKSIEATFNEEYLRGDWVQFDKTSLQFGLGWDGVNIYPFDQYGIDAYIKGGDTNFYHGSTIVIPEHNMAVAVLSAGGASTYNEILGSTILIENLLGEGLIDEILPPPVFEGTPSKTVPDKIMSYVGTYINITGFINVDITEEGKLTTTLLHNPSLPPTVLDYMEEGYFLYPEAEIKIAFHELNGEVYLSQEQILDLSPVGNSASSALGAVKVSTKDIDPELAAIWKERSEVIYIYLNEKYTSSLMISPFTTVPYLDEMKNYAYVNEIVDENLAKPNFNIPGGGSRDLTYYNAIGDYLVLNGAILYDNSKLNEIYGGSTSHSTILSPDKIDYASELSALGSIMEYGLNKAFKIGEDVAGKTISVDLPENSGFTVYDEKYKLLFSSYLSGEHTTTLPKGGIIYFAGSIGDVFRISLN